MSTLVPSILPMHTPSSFPILSAFPVHFPAFPHKTNNTLSCPQRKKDKNSKGTLYCPVHSLSVYTKEPIYCPSNPLSAHKRRKERDNNMPLLLCLRIRKGQYIIPLMHCLSARKGQYYVPLIFTAFPHVFYKRDNILPPLIYFPTFT